MQKDFLTIPQAAKICSVDRSTMHRWVTSGKIKSYRTPGGRNRIQIKDLSDYFRDNQIPIELNEPGVEKNRILIVDDDTAIQTYLTLLLDGPFTVTDSAVDGFDAGIKIYAFKPHLLILDLYMPNMDGFEVCRRIKENPDTKMIKILVMTGHPTHENEQKIMACGADAFLKKPAPKDEILGCIEALLAGRGNYEERQTHD